MGPAEAPQLPEGPARGAAPAARAAQVPAAPKPQIVVSVETRRRVRASPAARRLAAARGIDLAAITGSGPLGAIILYDVEHSGIAITPPVERKRTVGLDLDAMRTAIAAAMARSKREIPHYYLEHQVDVTGCEEFLSRASTYHLFRARKSLLRSMVADFPRIAA